MESEIRKLLKWKSVSWMGKGGEQGSLWFGDSIHASPQVYPRGEKWELSIEFDTPKKHWNGQDADWTFPTKEAAKEQAIKALVKVAKRHGKPSVDENKPLYYLDEKGKRVDPLD